MPRNPLEVIVGPATMWTSPLGTAFPADPSVTVTGAWTEIGYTDDGWTIVLDPKREVIAVTEELDAIQAPMTTRDLHVQGALKQASFANLTIAQGGGVVTTATGPPATQTYRPQRMGEVDTHLQILVRGKGPLVGLTSPVQKWRDFQIFESMSIAAVNVQYTKAPKVTLVAVDFKLFRPAAGGDPYQIIELT